MRVVIHKNGMLEMSIINVIFLTNVEKLPIFLVTQLLTDVLNTDSPLQQWKAEQNKTESTVSETSHKCFITFSLAAKKKQKKTMWPLTLSHEMLHVTCHTAGVISGGGAHPIVESCWNAWERGVPTVNQAINKEIRQSLFFVRLKVDQRSLSHVGITKTERNRTKT